MGRPIRCFNSNEIICIEEIARQCKESIDVILAIYTQQNARRVAPAHFAAGVRRTGGSAAGAGDTARGPRGLAGSGRAYSVKWPWRNRAIDRVSFPRPV